MSERAFFEPAARAAATEAVRAIESVTAAEIVVTLKRASAPYRDAAWLAGYVTSVAALLLLLFSPWPFPLAAFPIDVLAGFALGAFAATRFDGLKRALSMPSDRRSAVARAARAEMVDRGVTRTTGRTGILVYVSMLERRVEVVADVGVPVTSMGNVWTDAVGALERAIAPRPDFAAFVSALRALGPALQDALPRAADDVNELPDEVNA